MILVLSRVTARLLAAFPLSIDVPSCSPIAKFQTFRNPSQDPVMTRPSGGYVTVEIRRSHPSRGLGPVSSDPRDMTLERMFSFTSTGLILLRCGDRSHEGVMFEGETDIGLINAPFGGQLGVLDLFDNQNHRFISRRYTTS